MTRPYPHILDVHTHNRLADVQTSVVNLTLKDAELVLQTDSAGIYSIGVHPCYAQEFTDWELLEKLVTDKRVFAIGECGLDKKASLSLPNQIAVFKKQIELAQRLQKPLIIHCVGCFNELIEIAKSYVFVQPWIIHGFRGKPQLAQQLLNNGLYLSFGTKFNPESWAVTPPERRFTETD